MWIKTTYTSKRILTVISMRRVSSKMILPLNRFAWGRCSDLIPMINGRDHKLRKGIFQQWISKWPFPGLTNMCIPKNRKNAMGHHSDCGKSTFSTLRIDAAQKYGTQRREKVCESVRILPHVLANLRLDLKQCNLNFSVHSWTRKCRKFTDYSTRNSNTLTKQETSQAMHWCFSVKLTARTTVYRTDGPHFIFAAFKN